MSNHDGLGAIADLTNELERQVQERTVEPAELNEALQAEIAERKQAETLLAGQNRVLEMIAKGAPLADVLNVLARLVEEQSQQILCSILLLDRDGLHLRHSAAPSLPESYNRAIDGVAIGQGVGSWGTAAFLGQPMIVSDIATDPLWQDYRELALRHELRACWSTPIFSATNQVLGTFVMYYREVRRPTRRELHLIEIAMHLAGIAIARQRAEEELRQHMARAEALAKISQKLVEAGLDSKMALDMIAQHTAEAIGDACVIALLSSDGLGLKPVAFHHLNSEAKALISQVLSFPSQPVKDDLIAIQTGQSVLIPTIPREEMRQIFQPGYWPYLEQVGIHSMLIVPMRVKDQIIGTLGVTRDAPGRPYDADDQAFLLNLADRAALTITNAQLFEQVHDARQRLQALSHRLLEVQEIERRHIARELHDEIGQILTALTLILDMSSRLSTKAVRTSLNEAQTLVNELMERVDELALNLRPAMLDDLALLPALLWHFERYTRQTRVQVTFKHRRLEGRRFAPGVETAAYRIVQEALTNVARHAGVSQVTVRLWADSDTLDVQIEDQGVGFDPQAALTVGDSIGLSGMQKRAALLGGQLIIESAPGAGVCLTAELPLQGSA